MERAAIFIDGAYVDFLMRFEFPGRRVDHRQLIEELVPDRSRLMRTYYYTCPPHISGEASGDERDRQRAFDSFVRTLLHDPARRRSPR
jgi:hypothetical protein